jgi:polyphosphate kinase
MASKAGVKIKLLVRGICSLIPGIPGKSENIKAISLVDRYLEHGRIFIFHNNGNDEVYIGSADLMTRNIDYRIEVLCPILDSTIKKQIKDVFNIQWNGNVKIREFDKELTNSYRKRKSGQQIVRAQEETRKYYLDFFESKISKE